MLRHPTSRSLFVRVAGMVLGLSLAAAAVGCGNNKKAGTTAGEETLPPNKMAALREGDRLISEGQADTEQGVKLKNEGKDGDDLIKQGQEKMTRGEKIKEKGMMMKD